MQKKHIVFACIGVLATSFTAFSQNDIDAMRYSQLTFGGTARFASMAGSMGALGGDISTLSFNPAGIAVFKKTELSISPSIYSERTSSTYNNINQEDRKLNFNLGNIGLVASWNFKDTNSTWKNLNFGFGYNRTNNFHTRSVVEGYNTKSSLLDAFVNDANGHSPSDFDGFSTGLAWQAYLINPDTNANLIYNHVIPHYGEQQKKSVETTGFMGETVISFGGNYKNKLLVGATLGIVNARYSEESTYEEIDTKDTIQYFKSFSYTQNIDSRGRGVNLKLGAIIKPNDWLRIGAAIHTPTVIKMHDDYSSSMKSDLEDGVTYDTTSADGKFDYSVTTPFRAIGSVGFIINKMALLNAEYEYIDYSSAQLYSHPNYFSDVNKTIRSKYTSTGNFRIGGEVRFDPIAFRLGYALYGSPFKNGENVNANRSSYTAGIGFRDNNYFVDFAYVLTRYSEENFLYDVESKSPVKNDFRSSSFMLTMGVRF